MKKKIRIGLKYLRRNLNFVIGRLHRTFGINFIHSYLKTDAMVLSCAEGAACLSFSRGGC
jgi:hypothetical protein